MKKRNGSGTRPAKESRRAGRAPAKRRNTGKEAKLLTDFLNLTNDAILVRDMEGKVLFWNGRAEETYGWAQGEVLGKVAHDLLKTRFAQPPEEITAELLRRGRWEGRLVQARRDRSTITVSSRWALQRDGRGRPVAVLEVNTDVTDRKKDEKELRRLATVVEQATEGIIITDLKGAIQYINPAMEKKTGFTRDEVIGASLSLFGDKKRDRSLYREMWDSLRASNAWHGRMAYRTKDDQPRELELTVTPIKDSFGRLSHYAAVSRDVTGEAKLQQQIRQRQKLEAIGTLAGGIAHDFNNILAAIIGFAQVTLDDTPKGSQQRERMQHILKAGLRGRDLVKQILTFSQQAEQERKPIQLAPVISESLKLLRGSLPAGIDLRQGIRSKAWVSGDPSQLRQMVMNLSTNAAHAMREKGGVLTVNLADAGFASRTRASHPEMKPGRYAKLTVSDTGCGIEKGIIERIFDPFFTTKQAGVGVGLGLSIVHGIVKSHDGLIVVTSEPGMGSTFTVFLPAVKGRRVTNAKVDTSKTRGQEQVLFVDDEYVLVEMGKEVLERLGYKVTAETDGMRALELFRQYPDRFDVVITDQVMPQITGLELAREMIAIKPDIPVILCTGFSESVNADSASAAGVDAFLMKPLTRQEMAETIHRVLGKTP